MCSYSVIKFKRVSYKHTNNIILQSDVYVYLYVLYVPCKLLGNKTGLHWSAYIIICKYYGWNLSIRTPLN